MIYLLDDDQYSLIRDKYSCDFIFSNDYKERISFFKYELEFKIEFNQITKDDFVCYHNSFPNEETRVVDKLLFHHERNPRFKLVCFSNDSSFNTLSQSKYFIKMNKDLFYKNLKSFIDSECNVRKLFYGEMDLKNELDSLITGLKETLYDFPDDEILDLTYIKPSYLKRICEIAELDYTALFISIQEKNIGDFKKLLTALMQSF